MKCWYTILLSFFSYMWLFSLTKRRLRGDLLTGFNIFKWFNQGSLLQGVTIVHSVLHRKVHYTVDWTELEPDWLLSSLKAPGKVAAPPLIIYIVFTPTLHTHHITIKTNSHTFPHKQKVDLDNISFSHSPHKFHVVFLYVFLCGIFFFTYFCFPLVSTLLM